MKSVLALLFCAFFTGVAAFAGAPPPATIRPVVVELYTSQGCNSCFAANALAGKLAQKPGLLVLSFSVSYWDMFGWKDTLATEDNTKRQKSYASALHRGGIYTPQLIIDGVRDVPASRPDAVASALDMATMVRDGGSEADAKTPAVLARRDVAVVAGARIKTPALTAWSAGVSTAATPEGLHVTIARAPEHRRLETTVWMFRLRSAAKVKITAGENAGKTVAYKNVVTGIQNLGSWHGEARSFDIAKPAGNIAPYDAVAIVVQQAGYGRIIGAAYQPGPFN